jgi:hypothetical protein
MAKLHELKRGQFVKSNALNKIDDVYTITNEDMIKGEVINFDPIGGKFQIKVIEHLRESSIGGTHWVQPKYFDVIEKEKEKPINTILVGGALADLINRVKDKYNVDWSTGIFKVLYNDKVVVTFTRDGKKTVARVQEGDKFELRKGLAVAILKKKHYEIKKQLKKF